MASYAKQHTCNKASNESVMETDHATARRDGVNNHTGLTSMAKSGGSVVDSLRSQEYEAQYFGWTPKSFSDGMYNAVLEYTWDAFRAAQMCIKTNYPDLATEEQHHKAATKSFFPKINQVIDKAFDKFEIYLLSNIFHIPDNVLLPEDERHYHSDITQEQEAQLDSQLNDLKRKIVTQRYVSAAIAEETEQAERVIRMYEEFAAFQDTLDRLCKEAGVSDLKDSLVFGNEKAQRILRILNQLQPPVTKSILTENEEDIQMDSENIQL